MLFRSVDVVLVPSPEFVAQYEKAAKRTRALAWTSTALAIAAAGGAGGLYGLSMGNATANKSAVAEAQAAKDARNRPTASALTTPIISDS